MASTYAFANAKELQRRRLAALEQVLDPGTTAHLEALGVAPGWSCLEIGAGGGSIAGWMCDRVQPGGWVLATDLDTTVLRDRARAGLVVKVHDVARDELPAAAFDLVHTRLVLAWLGDPTPALARIMAALKPGGVLLAEEMDFSCVHADPALGEELVATFARVKQAHDAVLAARHSFDPLYGSRVAGDLRRAGLTATGTAGRAAMWRGGEPGGTLWQLTLVQLRDAMAATGHATAAEIDEIVACFDDPAFAFVSPLVMAAWGRAPG